MKKEEMGRRQAPSQARHSRHHAQCHSGCERPGSVCEGGGGGPKAGSSAAQSTPRAMPLWPVCGRPDPSARQSLAGPASHWLSESKPWAGPVGPGSAPDLARLGDPRQGPGSVLGGVGHGSLSGG